MHIWQRASPSHLVTWPCLVDFGLSLLRTHYSFTDDTPKLAGLQLCQLYSQVFCGYGLQMLNDSCLTLSASLTKYSVSRSHIDSNATVLWCYMDIGRKLSTVQEAILIGIGVTTVCLQQAGKIPK